METYGWLLIGQMRYLYKARKSNSSFHPFNRSFHFLARGTCLVFPDTGVVFLLFQRLKNFDSTKPSTPTVHYLFPIWPTCFQDQFSLPSLLSLFPFRPFPNAKNNAQYAASFLFLTPAHYLYAIILGRSYRNSTSHRYRNCPRGCTHSDSERWK